MVSEELYETNKVMLSELLMNFTQTINYNEVERNTNGIKLFYLIHSILSNHSVYTSAPFHLMKSIGNMVYLRLVVSMFRYIVERMKMMNLIIMG